ncbi:adrenodoxin-like protein ferredoxin 2fe-2s-like protein [Lotmaria passim]
MRCCFRFTTRPAVVAVRRNLRLYNTPGKVNVRVKRSDGTQCDMDVPVGISLMQALRDVAKLDVEGTCDGEMECGTCHVYLSKASFAKAGEPSEEEQDLLDKVFDVRETSRLSCQVELTPEMDGMDVELPSNTGNVR